MIIRKFAAMELNRIFAHNSYKNQLIKCVMKKFIFPLLIWGGLLLTGCDKDEVSGDFQLGGVSKSVTSAVVYLYDRTSEETNYEVYLMLDGTEWDSEYGAAVYFDLYFEGAVDELPAGNYALGGDVLDCVEYSSYTGTEESGAEIVSGTLTVGKDGNNWSFKFEGKASVYTYDYDTGDYVSGEPQSFSCSYSGPVTYTEYDYDEYQASYRIMKKSK